MEAKAVQNSNPKTILIVDDEEGVREVVSEVISSMGFLVHRVENGEKALSLLSNIGIDMVISDVRMDGMDGITLVQHLRERFPHMPLALMTAYPSEDVQRLIDDKHIDFLLQKPFLMEELEGMVQKLAG